MEDVTVCVPTFERPECLAALLESVRRFMPTSPILVADQGRELPAVAVAHSFGARADVLPHDCGVCAARNYLLRTSETPLVFMLDDDMVLHEGSKPDVLASILRETSIDLIAPALDSAGGKPFVFCGLIEKTKDALITHHGWNRGVERGCEIVDFTFCIFMAKRERTRLVPWDERLKTAELMEWYWRASKILRIAQSRESTIEHRPVYSVQYLKYRERGSEQARIANEILGVRTRRGLHHERSKN